MNPFDDATNIALDRALELTFPASDPIAIYIAEKPVSAPNRVRNDDEHEV